MKKNFNSFFSYNYFRIGGNKSHREIIIRLNKISITEL